jgi:hypothetical protein
MPYVSDAQRRFFHSSGAARAGISQATVKEYDQASKGKKLPEKKALVKRYAKQIAHKGAGTHRS